MTATTTATRTSTGTRATRLMGIVTLAGMAWLVAFGLLLSPPDAVQGESVRLLYVHVPAANIAYLSFAVTAFCGVMYLWPRTRSLGWDRVAGASAEAGVLFTGICLATGMVWGQMSWGVWWTWDARLTTTALLFVLFLGYLAIRRLPASFEVRAKRSAIAGLIAFVDVPLVHVSVDWWRTLHQKSTLKRLDPTIDGLMLFSLFVGFVAFLLAYVWMVVHRYRIAVLTDALDTAGLDAAIDERVREGAVA